MRKIIFFVCFLFVLTTFAQNIPDFKSFPSVAVRNQAFIDFILVDAQVANEMILTTRRSIVVLQKKYQAKKNLTREEINWVNEIADYYGLDDFNYKDNGDWQKLLARVDIVPVSLALAQAVHETAWGTSRFAREGLNYFGLWCHTPGCGMVPLKRSANAGHEVRVFSDPLASIQAYMHFLNTHAAFANFRQLREKLRAQDQPIAGLALVVSIGNYAQNGAEYIRIVNKLILRYDFGRYDIS